MEMLLLVMAIASVASIVLNHRHAREAMEGVEFRCEGTPETVAASILHAFGRRRIRPRVVMVERHEEGRLETFTSLGDRGMIEIRADGSSSVVRAFTTELHVGSPWRPRGPFILLFAITHLMSKMVGFTPRATAMRQFQRRLPERLARQEAKRRAS